MADHEHFRLVLHATESVEGNKHRIRWPFAQGQSVIDLGNGKKIIRVEPSEGTATAANTGSATDDILIGSGDALATFKDSTPYTEALKTLNDKLYFMGWVDMIDFVKISPNDDKDDFDVLVSFTKRHDGGAVNYVASEGKDSIRLLAELIDSEVGLEEVNYCGPFRVCKEAGIIPLVANSELTHTIGVETEVRRHDLSAFTVVSTVTMKHKLSYILVTEPMLALCPGGIEEFWQKYF